MLCDFNNESLHNSTYFPMSWDFFMNEGNVVVSPLTNLLVFHDFFRNLVNILAMIYIGKFEVMSQTFSSQGINDYFALILCLASYIFD